MSTGTANDAAQNSWHLYLLRAADGSLYTGITTDVARRLGEHNSEDSDRGAKALRGKRPLDLVFTVAIGDRSKALQLEYRVKQLSRADKEALVDGRFDIFGLIDD